MQKVRGNKETQPDAYINLCVRVLYDSQVKGLAHNVQDRCNMYRQTLNMQLTGVGEGVGTGLEGTCSF
jgi:hypothetical protein